MLYPSELRGPGATGYRGRTATSEQVAPRHRATRGEKRYRDPRCGHTVEELTAPRALELWPHDREAPSMADKNRGNRETRKPKKDKKAKAVAPTSIVPPKPTGK